MKNLINYYYNLIIKTIHQKNDMYYFTINNNVYLFVPFKGNINYLDKIYRFLLSYNIYCHEIVYNKDNNILTDVDNQFYCLLRVYYNNQKQVSIDDIIFYNIPLRQKKTCNWFNLWCEKLNYYERQVREFGKKYPLIRDSFSYYDGLCETAICYLNNIEVKEVDVYLNHRRIYPKMNLIDFYNPLDLMGDVRVRDACEYFKNKFFNNDNILNKIEVYLLQVRLSYVEMILFFTRFLYPSYYFDMYDKIINGYDLENKLNHYIDKINDYEIFLDELFKLLNKSYHLPPIEWLIKT